MSGNARFTPIKVKSFVTGGLETRRANRFDLPAAAQPAVGVWDDEKIGVSDPAWMCGPDFKF